ncbi:uncharacterized protein LOC110747435, partial [Prunus avium]|uniref:Uncharacterized protein LOC110747435 n=1 Tax=Prunus avium TaxID=42229 RepID=A0A6P5REG9_PRUAV
MANPVIDSEPGPSITPAMASGSFRDKLMNKLNLVKNCAIEVDSLATDYVELNDDEDVVISRGGRGPSIQFSERAMNRLCQPWKNALILKFLGRSHTYNYIHDRLQQKWCLKGGWKLIDLVNDYFVAKFDLEEDMNHVLTEGPWVISGQYLTLQKWRPGFCPTTAHISRMAVWIRVSAIQLECFDVWALKRIGNLLGKLLKIDAFTTSQNRGKFARLCIEIDLTKPLDAFVQINQVWYNIEYEGLPDICYLCGLYGHKRENCRQREKPPAKVTEDLQAGKSPNQMEPDTNMEHVNAEKVVDNLRGPWMIVPPRRKPKNGNKGVGEQSNGLNYHGSRFEALRQNGEETGADIIEEFVATTTAPKVIGVNTSDSGKKVWTKSKAPKWGTRTALEDTTNQSRDSRSKGENANQRTMKTKKAAQAGTSTIGMNGDKWQIQLDSGIDRMASWVKDKPLGGFIFGHQPPTIDPGDKIQAEECEAHKGDDPLVSNAANGLCQVEGMDISEGQILSIGEVRENHTSSQLEGAASTKFKVNLIEIIKLHRIDLLFICEPRIGGNKALKIIKSLGFTDYEVVNPVGFSGGLWLLWNASKIKVEILGTSDQTITASVSGPGNISWLFSAIYASPCGAKREKLWDYLNFVASCHRMPWLIAGDFNDMLQLDDKVGGTPLSRLKGFKKWFDENDMIDLGYSGTKYTWSNKRIFERLDRAICNTQWRHYFADAFVQHLPRTNSDHCPIKICLKSRLNSCPNRRPFRFEAMWLKHVHFQDFITLQWENGTGTVLEKSSILVEPLKQWNLTTFGHLNQRKAKLLARINGIQRVICHTPNNFLSFMEEDLMEEYNSILEQEALFWQQKSRVMWLQEGDRNTKFFHLTTIIRRRRNRIEKLQNDSGEWVENSNGLKELAVNYFLDLFSLPQRDYNSSPIPNLFPQIMATDLTSLIANVSISEVKNSLFNIGGLKTPGVDGFPACFYQNQWNLCGIEIYEM